MPLSTADKAQFVSIVVAILALIFTGLSFNSAEKSFADAATSHLAASLVDVSNLAARCPQSPGATATLSPSLVWAETCHARELAFSITYMDIFQQTPQHPRVLNEAALNQYTINLEDEIVRVLDDEANRVVANKSLEQVSQEDRSRIRRTLVSTYMLVHPGSKSDNLEQGFKKQVEEHQASGPSEHRDRFLHFAQTLNQISQPAV